MLIYLFILLSNYYGVCMLTFLILYSLLLLLQMVVLFLVLKILGPKNSVKLVLFVRFPLVLQRIVCLLLKNVQILVPLLYLFVVVTKWCEAIFFSFFYIYF